MIDAYKQSVFAYEDSALATVLVGFQKLAERVSADCISLSIVYTGDFIYIKQLDKEYFCLVRSIRIHQDSAESRFVSKTHSKT